MEPVNSGLHRRKNFSENNPQFGHMPSKMLAVRTHPRPQKFKEYRFEGATTRHGPAMVGMPAETGPWHF